MSVFNDSNISEKSASTFLQEKGIPVSNEEWTAKLNGLGIAGIKSEVFESDTSAPYGTFSEPRIGIIPISGNTGVRSVWIYNKTQSDTEWTQIYPPALPSNILTKANDSIGEELKQRGIVNGFGYITGARLEIEEVNSASDVIAPTSNAFSLNTIRAFVTADNDLNITDVHEIWLFTGIDINQTGAWTKLYPQESSGGGSAAPTDARVLNTNFSPNGLFTSTHRGETFVTGTVNNDYVSTSGCKIWYAVNGNSNNSWVQIN